MSIGHPGAGCGVSTNEWLTVPVHNVHFVQCTLLHIVNTIEKNNCTQSCRVVVINSAVQLQRGLSIAAWHLSKSFNWDAN